MGQNGFPWGKRDPWGKAPPEDRAYLKPMEYHPTPAQRATGRVGRNDPCPCGSGKKFKKCCLEGKKKP